MGEKEKATTSLTYRGDRHGGYNDHPPDQRQLCWAHIIRNMERIAERKGQAGRLGQLLVRWARLTIRVEHRWQSSQYASDAYRQRLIRLRRHFYAELEHGSTQYAKAKTGNQCRRLLKDEAMLWTFLSHPATPLTNNAAERALRPYVIWRKTSFASQSYRGDQFRPLILSITETCKRLGVSAYSLLRSACEQGQRGESVSVRLPIPQDNLLLPA